MENRISDLLCMQQKEINECRLFFLQNKWSLTRSLECLLDEIFTL